MEQQLDTKLTEEVSDLLTSEDADTPEVDLGAWLTHAANNLTDFVTVKIEGKPHRLKIAAITEEETMDLLKLSRRLNRQDVSKSKVDFMQYRLLLIAYSLNKAAGMVTKATDQTPATGATPKMLQAKLSGELTKIQQAIFGLSGLDDSGQSTVKVEDSINDFFG